MVSRWECLALAALISGEERGLWEEEQVTVRAGACLSTSEERTELNSRRQSDRLVGGELASKDERMSAKKEAGSIDRNGRIILVKREGLFLIGIEMEARTAS